MEKICPVCDNHCPSDKLKCPRGMKHFGIKQEEKDISDMTPDEAVIVLMRKCGHYLHHNMGESSSLTEKELLSVLSDAEKNDLITLLNKCVKHWNK